jgi:hypothetical protein
MDRSQPHILVGAGAVDMGILQPTLLDRGPRRAGSHGLSMSGCFTNTARV